MEHLDRLHAAHRALSEDVQIVSCASADERLQVLLKLHCQAHVESRYSYLTQP